MKRSTSIAAIAAVVSTISLAGVQAAPASPATTAAPPLNATITTPSFLILGCCHHSIFLAPTEVVIPRIGRAVVAGSIRWCGSPCGPESGTTLSIVFTTPSDGTLTLGGFTPAGTTPLVWTVLGGTGRFAGSSGSGSYSYQWGVAGDDFFTTVVLSGTLRMRS